MNLLIRILLTSILVLVITRFFPSIAYVENFTTSIIVAVVLGLLNLFVKPLLILLTFPVTVLTLGLFLLVINAVIIIICSKLVDGFKVDGFLGALLFSIILSILQSILFAITRENK